MKAHYFVGLDKPVYLPDDIIVEKAIVPETVRNVRSNAARAASQVTSFTQHETANFAAGADAEMHKRWLHSGAGGAYVGFNFVVDDKKIIQLTPLDEITWAAGTAAGNLTSDHSELCVNEGIDHNKARRNAAALAAGVLAARGLGSEDAVQHYKWYGKNCPLLMRRNNEFIWKEEFMPMVRTFHKAALSGGTAPTPPPTPAPTYPAPQLIPGADSTTPVIALSNGAVLIYAPVMLEALRDTARLQAAWAGAKPIGPKVAKGSKFAAIRLIINADGSHYWYTKYGTRILGLDVRVIGKA